MTEEELIEQIEDYSARLKDGEKHLSKRKANLPHNFLLLDCE